MLTRFRDGILGETAPTSVVAVREAIAAKGSDAIFVSYPKTGNTWARLILGNYFMNRLSLTSLPLFDEAPSLRRRRDGLPRYRFTHAPLHWHGQHAADLRRSSVTRPYLGSRVVLIARHPLDVLVSHWHQAAGRTPKLYRGSLDDFVLDPVFGLDKLLRFYGLWETQVLQGRAFLLRYEDLSADTFTAVESLLGFLSVDVDAPALRDAIGSSTFDALRALERREPDLRYRGGGAVFSPRVDDGETPHIRRGEIGAYRSEISRAIVVELEHRVELEMPTVYGYPGT